MSMDITSDGAGDDSSATPLGDCSELERIKKECSSMIKTLQVLHEEERQLHEANKNFAQRAMIMGCTAGLDGGTRRGARRKAAAKEAQQAKKAKQEAAATAITTSTATSPKVATPLSTSEITASASETVDAALPTIFAYIATK